MKWSCNVWHLISRSDKTQIRSFHGKLWSSTPLVSSYYVLEQFFWEATKLSPFQRGLSVEHKTLDGITRKKIRDWENRKIFMGFRYMTYFSREIGIQYHPGEPLFCTCFLCLMLTYSEGRWNLGWGLNKTTLIFHFSEFS